MSIRVECPTCQVGIRVADEFAGKRGKCPRCKTILEIPALKTAAVELAPEPEPDTYELQGAGPKVRTVPLPRRASQNETSSSMAKAVEPTRPSQAPAQILAALRGQIEPVRPTLLYRFWIGIVAAFMILLPIIYVAIVALVGIAVGWHATHNISVFQSVRNAKAAVLIYIAPLVVGVIVVAFMLKPLFARPAKREKTRVLDPSREPLLFAFVDGICMAVGSPRPVRIEVNSDVNASAHRSGGPLAIFNNDLVLTIGLPLAAGLSLVQFAGVLAHEFGHFSQGAGMRLSNLIRSINRWFARVVYERDEWDEALVSWSGDGNGYQILIVGLARLAIWLTRRILWILMMVGHAVSSILSRQMEFDADRYEARMVGSDVFAQSTRRLAELNLAAQGAYADLASSWQERRLPDNLPKLILANIPQIHESTRQALREAEKNGRTGLFDTHPCDRERIARAEAEDTDGIFRLAGPATDLFRAFDSLARAVTFDHFRAILGPGITKEQLYPVADSVQNQEVTSQGFEASSRFFLGVLSTYQILPLPSSYPAAPADLKAAKRALVEARSAMEATRIQCLEAGAKWVELHGRFVNAEAARFLLKAGNRIKAADFMLDAPTTQAAEGALRKAEFELRDLQADFESFNQAAATRLSVALGLLEADAISLRVPDGPARREEARALYPCANLLCGRLMGEISLMLRSLHALGVVCRLFSEGNHGKNESMINACLRGGNEVHDRLRELQWKIGDVISYPFEHAQENVSLTRFALPLIPQNNALGELLQVGEECSGRLTTLHQRVLGRLCVTAEEVERVLGLPPLTIPDQPAPNVMNTLRGLNH